MLNIAVLVSGGGSNLQAIIDALEGGVITNAQIRLVLSSNPKAYALERAEKHNIPHQVLARKEYDNSLEYSNDILKIMQEREIDLIVLAGFMTVLQGELLNTYKNKIINVHPALIPSFCGDGFYGLHVHEKVLEYGVKLTGATVHFVNDVTDGGAIILQKGVEVKNGDTPETLQKRVMQQAEWIILPKAVDLIANGRVEIRGNRAYIKE